MNKSSKKSKFACQQEENPVKLIILILFWPQLVLERAVSTGH